MGQSPKGAGGKNQSRIRNQRDGKRKLRTLEAWVADVAVECNIGIHEAAENSIAQLKLMEGAAKRRNARNVLAQMEAVAAAVAASMTKKGGKSFEKLQAQWAERAEL